MHTFRNVNDGFKSMLSQINSIEIATEEFESRNGPCIRCVDPQMWCFTHPQQRVLFNAARDANPFFHVYEAMWMLAGRDDVGGVAHYCAQMREYSDDKFTINDAYGYRWRHWFDCDQLEAVIQLLRSQPTTRRAVLGMWDPANDLDNMESKALPCNTHCYFKVRHEACLDLMVCNRSNDLIWGAFGANTVHFSFLLEYVAARTGLDVGYQYHMSNDLHLYTDRMQMDKWLADETPSVYDQYEHRIFSSLVGSPDDLLIFNEELQNFVDAPTKEYECFFFKHIASPMARAWEHHKERRYGLALEWADQILALDWKRACITWLKRRQRNWETDDK